MCTRSRGQHSRARAVIESLPEFPLGLVLIKVFLLTEVTYRFTEGHTESHTEIARIARRVDVKRSTKSVKHTSQRTRYVKTHYAKAKAYVDKQQKLEKTPQNRNLINSRVLNLSLIHI